MDYAAQVSANDTEDGPLSVGCLPASGSLFPVGTTTVTCNAGPDSGGKTATATFSVTVNSDLTAPTLNVPENPLVVEASGVTTAVNFAVSASDNIDTAVSVVCTPASGSAFAVGTTSVTCVASDDFNNQATSGFEVEVIDTTAPLIDVPLGGIATQAPDDNGAIIEYAISANDLVEGTLSATCIPASGSLFPVGETMVSCSAEDAAGNSASTSFTVTVAEPNARADLALTISLPSAAVMVGEQFSAGLTLRNNGPNDANGIVLSLPLPAGLSFVSGGPSTCGLENSQIRCAVGTLAANSETSLQLRFSVLDQAATSIQLNINADAAEEDPLAANNSAAGTITTKTTDPSRRRTTS